MHERTCCCAPCRRHLLVALSYSCLYVRTVTDFLQRTMLTPAVRSVQKGLTSVKDSLAESWALSESEDEDEYYQRDEAQYQGTSTREY